MEVCTLGYSNLYRYQGTGGKFSVNPSLKTATTIIVLSRTRPSLFLYHICKDQFVRTKGKATVGKSELIIVTWQLKSAVLIYHHREIIYPGRKVLVYFYTERSRPCQTWFADACG